MQVYGFSYEPRIEDQGFGGFEWHPTRDGRRAKLEHFMAIPNVFADCSIWTWETTLTPAEITEALESRGEF